MKQPSFRYWVSYFCELNLSSGGLGIDLKGHIETGVYEISHPLNTQDDVDSFVNYLTKKENKNTTTGSMWRIHLLGFSLMYIKQ